MAVGVCICLSQLLGGASQRTAMLDSYCKHNRLSLVVSGMGAAMGWVSSWAGYWLAILSVSAPFPVPEFLVERINFGSKILWVGSNILSVIFRAQS